MRDYRREHFLNQINEFSDVVDIVSFWKNPDLNFKKKKWNFAVFYWNQFADDDYTFPGRPKNAEAKVWSLYGGHNMSYAVRVFDGKEWSRDNIHSTKKSPCKPVSMLLRDVIVSALKNNTSKNFRLVGHSLGTQLVTAAVHHLKTDLSKKQVPESVFPNRVALLDPYWGSGKKGFFLTSGISLDNYSVSGDSTVEDVSTAIYLSVLKFTDENSIKGIKNNFAVEYLDFSQLTDGKVFFLKMGDDNSKLRDIAATQYVYLSWIFPDEADTKYWGQKHVYGRMYYYWSYAYKPSLNGISASSSDADITNVMNWHNEKKTKMIQLTGRNTFYQNDDVFITETGSGE